MCVCVCVCVGGVCVCVFVQCGVCHVIPGVRPFFLFFLDLTLAVTIAVLPSPSLFAEWFSALLILSFAGRAVCASM